jgi:CRISPR-associated DxTHG motif protein
VNLYIQQAGKLNRIHLEKKELIIIAPIGDPSNWQDACYKIEDENHHTECTTTCSAIALAIHFSKEYSSILLFFQTIDALLCSSLMGDWVSYENLKIERDALAEKLKDYFKRKMLEAVESANVGGGDNVLSGEIEIRVSVSPSAGEYTLLRRNSNIKSIYFKGEPTAFFAKIINETIPIIMNKDPPPHICLDLTHGLNYLQAMAVYAVEVIASLYETEIKIVNFSPYPFRRRQPGKVPPQTISGQENPAEPPPILVKFDVSELLKIYRLTSSLYNMVFDKNDVETIRESIQKVGGDIFLQNFARHTALAWYYMSMGVVTLAYYHMCRASRIEAIIKNMLEREERIVPIIPTPDHDPNLKYDKLELGYNIQYSWHSAMPLIVYSMYNRFRKFFDDLPEIVSLEGLIKAVEKIRRIRPFYARDKFILKGEERNIKKRYTKIKSNKILKSIIPPSRVFPVDNIVLRTLIRKPLPDEAMSRISYIQESSGANLLEKLKSLIPSLELISQQEYDEKFRNLISHAGLTYEPLRNISIEEVREGIIDIKLEIEPGQLSDDPFGAWPLYQS